MPTLRSRFAAWLAVALLLGIACDEQDHQTAPCGPLCAGGVIEGHVRTGDVPTTVRITALNCTGGGEFTTVADEAGRFHLDLPVGRYVLRAYRGVGVAYYSAAGPPYPHETRDTLSVEVDTVIVADFVFGGLEVTVATPWAPDGYFAHLEGYPADADVGPAGDPLHASFSIITRVQDGQTRFAVGAVEPGSYVLRLRLPHLSSPIFGIVVEQGLWLPSARLRAGADTVSVPPEGTAHYEPVFPSNPARLTGSITGSWQELCNFAPQITLVTADSSATVATFRPEADGTFDVDIYVPEPARMLIDMEGSLRWYPRGNFAEAEVLDLAPGSSPPPITVVESGLLLDVRCSFYPGGWDARVQLVAPSNPRPVVDIAADGSGGQAFLGLANLDPGSYRLCLRPQRFLHEIWRLQWYDRAGDSLSATLIEIPVGGESQRITITLEEGGRIEGNICFADTCGTYGVTVYVTGAADPATLGRLWPNARGRRSIWGWQTPGPYVALGLPEGEYKIGVWPKPEDGSDAPAEPPAGTIWYPETSDWNAAQVFTIVGAQAITGIDFHLP